MAYLARIIIFHSLTFYCYASRLTDLTNLLKSLENSDYNKNVLPDNNGRPIMINITVHIKDISSVSEAQMDFTVDFYFRQTWNDNRLKFNETEELKRIIVGPDFMKKIWIPDTFFVNSKQTSLHTGTNLETSSYLRIKSNGDVFYSLRVSVVALCQMDLKDFPMDRQVCNIEVESYGYSANEIEYSWDEKTGSTIESDISLPNFKIEGNSRQKIYEVLTTGNYSRLVYKLIFTRSIGYYVNHIYVPALMIVMISWIPFWLDRDDNLARIGLGVTTVLTITTLISNINSSMPKISYMKSIDIYLEFCFAMVFASLIQYAIVGYFTTKNRYKSMKLQEKSDDKEHRHPTTIDFHSRWIFPSVYIVFNLLYWNKYIN